MLTLIVWIWTKYGFQIKILNLKRVIGSKNENSSSTGFLRIRGFHIHSNYEEHFLNIGPFLLEEIGKGTHETAKSLVSSTLMIIHRQNNLSSINHLNCAVKFCNFIKTYKQGNDMVRVLLQRNLEERQKYCRNTNSLWTLRSIS